MVSLLGTGLKNGQRKEEISSRKIRSEGINKNYYLIAILNSWEEMQKYHMIFFVCEILIKEKLVLHEEFWDELGKVFIKQLKCMLVGNSICAWYSIYNEF